MMSQSLCRWLYLPGMYEICPKLYVLAGPNDSAPRLQRLRRALLTLALRSRFDVLRGHSMLYGRRVFPKEKRKSMGG